MYMYSTHKPEVGVNLNLVDVLFGVVWRQIVHKRSVCINLDWL